MKRKRYMCNSIKILGLVGLLCLTSFAFHAQGQNTQKSQVKILHSDKGYPDMRKKINRLIGNVRLKHENILMWCDSLYQYQDSNQVEAFGHVRAIQNDTIEMTGDYMFYDGNTRLVQLRNNVTLKDSKMTLTTNYLDYDGIFEIGYYFNWGNLKDSINTLNSKRGTYFTKTHLAFFKDSVKVISPKYLIHSDTLKYNSETKYVFLLGPSHIYGRDSARNVVYTEDGWYDTNTGHAELYKNNILTHETYTGIADTVIMDTISKEAYMRRNIVLYDSINNVIVKGHRGWMNQLSNEAFVTDSTLLIMVGQQDSLFLHSDSLFMNQDSAQNNILRAYHRVRFYSQDIQGACDSMVYNTTDSLISLYHDPVAWTSGYQITAEQMSLLTGQGKVKEFYLQTKAMMIGQRDTVRRDSGWMFDQIKGRNMTGYFRNNEIYMVYVNGNGETIYFPDDQGVIIGANRATSSDIRILINQRKVSEITFLNTPEGEMTPLFLAYPEELKLKDFRWLKYRQPKNKHDIFNYPTPPPSPKKATTTE